MTARRPAWLVPGLAAGQVVGWGATYFMPSVLGPAQERDLGLPPGAAVAGVTLMLGLSALLAPRVGRFVAARGARAVMPAGSLLMAAGLALMAAVSSWPLLVLAWAVLGLAAPLCLTEPANAAIVQAGPQEARRRIGALMLVTGLTATIAWPLLAWAEAALGWRGTLLAAAAANLACAALHRAVATGAPVIQPAAGIAARAAWTPPLRLLAAALTLGAVVTSGVSVALIGLLEFSGLSRAGAVAMASLFGPVQVAARAVEMATARRRTALRTAVLAAAMLPPAYLIAMLPGSVAALVFVTLFGVGGGLVAVMRPSCVLELADGAPFAAVQGRVMAWVTLGMAASPTLIAALIAMAGHRTALMACAAGSLGSVLLLRAAARRAPA